MYGERIELAHGLLIAGREALEYLGLEEFGDGDKAALPNEEASGIREEILSIIMERINKDPDLIRMALEISERHEVRISDVPEEMLYTLKMGYGSTEETETLERKLGSYWDLVYEAWDNLFQSGRIGPEKIAVPVCIDSRGYRTEVYPCGIDFANAVWVPYQETLRQLKQLNPNLSHSERFTACKEVAKNDLLEYEDVINEERESEWEHENEEEDEEEVE